MKTEYLFMGGKVSVGGSGEPYTSMVTKPRAYTGFTVELWADEVRGERRECGCDCDEGESLTIKGDGTTIREMLTQMLSIVDSMEEHSRRVVEEEAARQVQCPVCQMYVDPFQAWHADGKGGRCQARHTAMIEAPPVLPSDD